MMLLCLLLFEFEKLINNTKEEFLKPFEQDLDYFYEFLGNFI